MKSPGNQDERWMREALSLAARGRGCTRPNPPVGAVVVRHGKCVGKGYHRRAGGPHAEVVALRRAGDAAAGAELYVTLEPCSTHGRTPPCTQAILDSGIRRVVVAVTDPNPRHHGRGIRLLRRAGVEVRVGPGRGPALEMLAPFFHWVTTGRPYVTLKLGMTVDGRLADHTGKSRWITGPVSRQRVQQARCACDAVMVGSGTAVADDPSLLPRPGRGGQPYRVIVDSSGSLSPQARVFTDGESERTIIATTRRCPETRRKAYEQSGARVFRLAAKRGHVSLALLLNRLGRQGLLHVFCEGGGILASSLVREGLVNEYLFFMAPSLLGGDGIPAFAGGWGLKGMPRLRFQEVSQVGTDVMIRAYPGEEG